MHWRRHRDSFPAALELYQKAQSILGEADDLQNLGGVLGLHVIKRACEVRRVIFSSSRAASEAAGCPQ
jgi:hypothetical protein